MVRGPPQKEFLFDRGEVHPQGLISFNKFRAGFKPALKEENDKNGILSDRLFQGATGFEFRRFGCRDFDALAASGISPRPCLPFGHCESAESSQRDSTALFQLLRDIVCYGVDSLGSCHLRDLGLLGHSCDQFLFRHTRPSFVWFGVWVIYSSYNSRFRFIQQKKCILNKNLAIAVVEAGSPSLSQNGSVL